jgi:hypothetical protein
VEEAQDEFMKAWREQARRPDRLGEYSHRWLELVHAGVRFTARELTRLERATEPPHRPVAPPPAVPVAAKKTTRPAAARRRTRAPARHEAAPKAS